jgi:hypothetical protein
MAEAQRPTRRRDSLLCGWREPKAVGDGGALSAPRRPSGPARSAKTWSDERDRDQGIEREGDRAGQLCRTAFRGGSVDGWISRRLGIEAGNRPAASDDGADANGGRADLGCGYRTVAG